jgi:hypothetical protein
MSRAERIAYNEAWTRRLNERMADWPTSGLPAAGFRCECWVIDCPARVKLSGREWRDVRSRANRFAVAPGHTVDLEDVVDQRPHVWFIEKRGEAGRVAADLA